MDRMDEKALLNRKKQLLSPYTAFVMRQYKRFKGTEHEKFYSVSYEAITNDRKILTNQQIDKMKAMLLELQLKANGVPFMQNSAHGQGSNDRQRGGGSFNEKHRSESRNDSADGWFKRRDRSRPAKSREDFKHVAPTNRRPSPSPARRRKRELKKFFRGMKDSRFEHQPSSLSPSSNASEPRGNHYNGNYFDRSNPRYSRDERVSRSPGRRSHERYRDPRLNHDRRWDTDRNNDSSPRYPRNRDKSVDPRLNREKSLWNQDRSNDSSPRDPRNRDKSVDPRLNREKSLWNQDRSNDSSPRDPRMRDKSVDPRLTRDKSRDPRLTRDKSRDPRLQKSPARLTSKERAYRATGGWFDGTGAHYADDRSSNQYSNEGWFKGSRKDEGRDRSRSKSTRRSRRSRSLSPPSYQRPNKFSENRSRSHSKAANVNSRFNKSMPRSPIRNAGAGLSANNEKPQFQRRAQTEQNGSVNKRYVPEIDGRRKLHHGMLKDIKEHIMGNKKKPPPRRTSCYVPKEPEVAENPESFAKIRQRRKSCFESKEPEVVKKPEPVAKGDEPKTETKIEDLYRKASEITVGKSQAIVAASKILSKKHKQPEEMAKHLVKIFGPELFLEVVRKQLASDSDGDASSNNDLKTVPTTSKNKKNPEEVNKPSATVVQAPSTPTVEEPPQKKMKISRPTKVIQLSMDEVIELSKNQVAQESRSDKKTKAVSLSKADRSISAEAIAPKSSKAAPPRRNSIGLKPGPKKSKTKESPAAAKPKQPEKVVKSTKTTQKEVSKPTVDKTKKKAETPKSSADSAACEAGTELASAAPPKRKKRKNNELDKLHEQIKDFYDGSQIASMGSKRACTKQPHNYAGEQTSAESNKVVTKDDVPRATKEQLAKYKIKHARISLHRLSLDGIAMPVKLDSENRPIIMPKKNQPPVTVAKKQPVSPKTIVETAPLDARKLPIAPQTAIKLPMAPQTARKRVGIWTKGLSPKKPKISSSLESDDGWEDIEVENKDAHKLSPKSKKMKLKKLVDCMDFWSKTIKKKFKAKQLPVTAAPPKEDIKSAESKPTTKESSALNFEVKILSPNTRSYQCKLCLFNSEVTEKFIEHIKSNHTLVHYPKPCLQCNAKTNGTMESEFRHMLTHYADTKQQATANATEARKPIVRSKLMAGDRLSANSPVTVQEVKCLAPSIKPIAVKLPGHNPSVRKSSSLQLIPLSTVAKPMSIKSSPNAAPLPTVFKPVPTTSSPNAAPVTLNLKGTNGRKIVIKPSNLSSITNTNASLSPVPVQLKLLTPTNVTKQAVPINKENQTKAVQEKTYRVVSKSLELPVVQASKQPEPKQLSSGNVQEPAQQLSTEPKKQLVKVASVKYVKQSVAQAQLRSLNVPEPADSPNLQFYAEQAEQQAMKLPKIYINTTNKDTLLRPWLNEDQQSAKSTEIAKEMLFDQKCLAATYKCMGATCSFYTSNSAVFREHLNFHHLYQPHDKDNFLSCSYCVSKSSNSEDLITHIREKHGYDRFQCTYCFFRAYSDFHVFHYHQSKYHHRQLRSLIECSALVQKKNEGLQALKAANVPPLKCFFCSVPIYIESSYIEHLKSHTDKTVGYNCNKCSARVNISNVLDHFLCYGIGHYHCLHCFFGSSSSWCVENHLAEKHSSEIPYIVEREFNGSTDDPCKSDSLRLILIKKNDPTVMRINFTPKELINASNKDKFDLSEVEKATSNLRTEVPTSNLGMQMETSDETGLMVRKLEIIASTNAESAKELMISSVHSLANGKSLHSMSDGTSVHATANGTSIHTLADGTIILSSDEE